MGSVPLYSILVSKFSSAFIIVITVSLYFNICVATFSCRFVVSLEHQTLLCGCGHCLLVSSLSQLFTFCLLILSSYCFVSKVMVPSVAIITGSDFCFVLDVQQHRHFKSHVSWHFLPFLSPRCVLLLFLCLSMIASSILHSVIILFVRISKS